MWNGDADESAEAQPLTADYNDGTTTAGEPSSRASASASDLLPPSRSTETGEDSDTLPYDPEDSPPDDVPLQGKSRPSTGLKLDTSDRKLGRFGPAHSEPLSDHEDVELDSLGADSDDEFLPDQHSEPRSAAADLQDEEVLSAVVPGQDDPTLPTLTFRFWVLGTFFSFIGAAISQWYYFRSASLSLSLFFVQLVSYVMGNAMARWLPNKVVRLFGLEFTLNEGPFNVKEHTLIVVCASTSLGVAYAIDILAVQRLFYKTDIGPIGSILLLLTTQCIGYGMAGMLRKWLVEKKEMVWPGNLPVIALFNTLHGKDETGPSHAKSAADAERRMNFFTMVFFAATMYGFLPSYIAPTLTSIAFLCLLGGGPAGTISKTVAQLGSGYNGAGLFTFTFDWNYIGNVGPLYTPFWSQANYILSAIFFAWVITPIMYHADIWNAKNYPIFGTSTYAVDGNKWNASLVLHSNLTLNETAYEQNPIRLSTFWALMYGISFANLSAVGFPTLVWTHCPCTALTTPFDTHR